MLVRLGCVPVEVASAGQLQIIGHVLGLLGGLALIVAIRFDADDQGVLAGFADGSHGCDVCKATCGCGG